MDTISDGPPVVPGRRVFDRGLLLFTLGAVALIVAGLIAIPLSNRRSPALAPASTPEGAVQRFYQALQRDDYQAAYDLISAESKRKLSLSEFQQGADDDQRETQVRINETSIHGATATVEVSLTSYYPDDLFGSGESTYEQDVMLQREGDTWKIVEGPFYLPVR